MRIFETLSDVDIASHHAKAAWQFSRTAAAEGKRFVHCRDFHSRDDDLVGVLAAVANQHRLSARRAKCCNQTRSERFGFDDQVQFNHPPLTESVLEWTVR
jgi:hypothetical protein